MALQHIVYEEVLVRYTDPNHATHLLRQYRPYLETVPSMRRPTESLITIPLPIAQIQRSQAGRESQRQPGVTGVQLPCELVFLMCDPEWRVKTDVEILIFIHRPGEYFADLLNRWRQTQALLQRGYHWEMPLHHQDIFSEGAERRLPLFVQPDQYLLVRNFLLNRNRLSPSGRYQTSQSLRATLLDILFQEKDLPAEIAQASAEEVIEAVYLAYQQHQRR
jgi:hypothetical protein